MFKKFFNSPFIIVCFCIYIIITAFIFSSALTGSGKSGLQSSTTANVISDVVEFFTNKKVVLKNDGNTGKYPTSLEIVTPSETLMVGKTFKLNYKTFPNDFEIVAVSDINEKSAKETAEKNGIKNYYIKN